MRSWISPSKGGCYLRRTAGIILGSLVWLALSGGSASIMASGWQWRPSLEFATGHESDLILDPDLEGFVVPGGGFLDLTPGLSLSKALAGRSRTRIDGRLTVERFLNGERRLLLGGYLFGELLWRGPGPWQVRLTVGGTFFDDSERETIRRFDGGGETALGWSRGDWLFEIVAAGQGRRYPNLATLDGNGLLGTYTEVKGSLGAALSWQPSGRFMTRLEATQLGVDARDPLYDAQSRSWQGSGWWRMSPGTSLVVSGLLQQRKFTSRLPDEDTDSYLQAGLAVTRELGHQSSLTVRYAFARYTHPSDQSQDSHRVGLALTWRFGRSSSFDSTVPLPEWTEERPSFAREGEPHVFRILAPGAQRVVLIGDFNHWNPESHPLRIAVDGWWEVALALPVGLYQYAYLVDGQAVTPGEADRTVDDGFGGRNGLLEVLPR
jgi:hypothetical protein